MDSEGVLCGIIKSEDVLDVLKEEATEDMLRLAGVGSEAISGPLSLAFKSRLPWLCVNWPRFLAAWQRLSRRPSAGGRSRVLLPFGASQGGMGGIQTLTLAVRSMARELPAPGDEAG